MKYIKTYGDDNLKYKKGDYVLLDTEEFIKNVESDSGASNINQLPSDKAKITAIINNELYPYRIIFDVNDDDTSVSEDEIIRLLTPEEIENFEAQKNANKYNL